MTSVSLYAQTEYEEGKKIYESACITCHGADGKAQTDFSSVMRPRQLNKTLLSEEQSFQIIKEGPHYWGAQSEVMPAFKTLLRDEEISAVSHYIKRAFNSHLKQKTTALLNASKKLNPEEESNALTLGEKIFQKRCSKCHGTLGNGQSEFVEVSKKRKEFIYPYNLTRTLLNEEQIFLYAKHGGYYWGTYKQDMPSWKEKYSDIELKSVAKYVHQKIKKTDK
jgi:cbb3-type cytochrome c oxidase subunit III